ncbi:wax ester/triacylglycerol synthase domain-containing protein [Polaromonas sp.]|uniref:wax ester/triacylglycerol synthase domain-containing protein n=1 Tax=Polaromonas sp. TaxID=1869339 RepID=UPI0024889C5C|nr:wax ester/triacylglycerol synthase domain-containing protein [Polaromonas sp.]MDI1273672.1 wax ester/triacylglycerol synthase family O-acyltransferase [Polaromonas sp.]
MTTLTGLDATFLYLETPEMPMHVGSLNLCELPAGFRGSFHKAVKSHIGKRMHLAPVFSRKLVFMPLDLGHPLWVEADAVDINFHVRRAGPPQASTPPPGGSTAHEVASVGAKTRRADPTQKDAAPMTLAAVHKLCAQLHGELIDRNFPLWEFHIFDRIKLPDGKVVAGFFSKIHHAALDGKGGVMLANAMLDIGPEPREVAPPDPARRRRLESDLKLGRMIGSVFSSSLGQLAKLARTLPSAASTLGSSLARQTVAASASGTRPKMPLKLAPPTPFNTGIGKGRVFVTATLPLAECKAMGKAVGGSLNDMLLWICSTALRSYLSQHHTLPKKSLVAAMPVSLREAGASDASNLGNQVSMGLVELGTHLANPLRRMNAIMASTARVKTSMGALKGLLPTDYPSLLAPWLVGGAAKMALNAYGKSGMASRLPMVANLAISNVPGPPVPLYLAGARFLTFHPLSIIMHGLALNITLQTYAGQVDFGIVADKKALPHAKDLAAAITAAFREAQGLLGKVASSPPAVASPVKTPERAVASGTSLGKSPSVRRAVQPKISSIQNKAKTSNASSHGTASRPTARTSQKIKPRSPGRPARRSGT